MVVSNSQVRMGNGRHLLLFSPYTGGALAAVLAIAVILRTLVLI